MLQNNFPHSTAQKQVKENIFKISEEFLQKKRKRDSITLTKIQILHCTGYCARFIHRESKYAKQSKG